MLSIEEIKNLALLARIELSAREEKELQKELGAILDYVSQLKKVPIKEVDVSEAPTSLHQNLWRGGKILNVFRGDETVKEEADIKKGEHIKVKHIL